MKTETEKGNIETNNHNNENNNRVQSGPGQLQLNQLPNEMLVEISEFLLFSDLLTARLLFKRMREVIQPTVEKKSMQLLSQGERREFAKNPKNTAFHALMERGKNNQIIREKQTLKIGPIKFDITFFRSSKGMLQQAILSKNLVTIRTLLDKKKVDIDDPWNDIKIGPYTHFTVSPIDLAAISGHEEVVKLLLSYRPGISTTFSYRRGFGDETSIHFIKSHKMLGKKIWALLMLGKGEANCFMNAERNLPQNLPVFVEYIKSASDKDKAIVNEYLEMIRNEKQGFKYKFSDADISQIEKLMALEPAETNSNQPMK